jgi:hypothetical protein
MWIVDGPAGLMHILAQSLGKLRSEADLHRTTVWLVMVEGHAYAIAWFNRRSIAHD